MTTLPTEFSSLSDDIVHFIFHRHDLFQRNTFENGYLHFKLDPDHRINEKDQECNAGDKPDHQTLSRIGRDIDDHIDRAGDTDQWKHRTEWNLEGARRLWQAVAQDEDVDMRKDVGNHPENRTDKDQKADQLGGIITDISKEKGLKGSQTTHRYMEHYSCLFSQKTAASYSFSPCPDRY